MIGPYARHCVNGNKRIFKRKHEGLFILSWDSLSVDQLNALITRSQRVSQLQWAASTM